MELHDYAYNGVKCQATRRRPSSREDKKYERTVRYQDEERTVHYGQPNEQMERDVPERREAFLERHNCADKTDPFAPGFWACYDWQNTDEKQVKAVGSAIKRLDGKIYGGYGVVFTAPDSPDLEGDYFDEATDFWEDIPTEVVIYDHAMGFHPAGIADGGPELAAPTRYRIGKVVKRVKDENGIYFEFTLSNTVKSWDEQLRQWSEYVDEEHQQWLDMIRAKLDEGTFNFSTDSIGHLVERVPVRSGVNWIRSWPIPLISVTPKAAEPRARVGAKHFTGHEAQREAARPTPPTETESKEIIPMLLAKTSKGRELIARGVIEDNWNELKSYDWTAYVKAVEEDAEKQDGLDEDMTKQEGEMMAVLQPIAEQLAAALGVDADEATAMLVQLAAQVMSAKATGEDDMTEDAAAMYETSEDDMMAVGKASKFRQSVRSQMMRGNYKTKNVNVMRHATVGDPAYSITRHIRAITRPGMDNRYLSNIAKSANANYKALGINPSTAGGYLVPPEHSNQIIELLRAEAVMPSLCGSMPLNRDVMPVPTLTGAAAGAWYGENATLNFSEETFGQKFAIAKKYGILVPVSNELIDDSDPAVDQVIEQDIALTAALAVDEAVLLGAGVAGQPLGVLNTDGVTVTTLSQAISHDNIVDLVARVEAANVRKNGNWSWVWHPNAKAAFRKMTDDEGNLIWASEGFGITAAGPAQVPLLGYPWAQTTIAGLSNTSLGYARVFFGNWSDVLICMRKTLELKASDVAGDAFANDQTWIRAILRMDVVMRHAESVQVLTDVR